MESDPIYPLVTAAANKDAKNLSNRIVDNQMQALLTQAEAELDPDEGGCKMFFANEPSTVQVIPTVSMVTQVATKQPLPTIAEHRFGVCRLLNRNRGDGQQANLYPVSHANVYFAIGREADATQQPPKISDNAKISVLKKPKHGRVGPSNLESGWLNPLYVPNDNYEGDDSTVLLVEGNGYKVKIFYYFTVTSSDGMDIKKDNPNCRKVTEGGGGWKISSLSTDPISLASLQRSNDLATILASASNALTNFTNLPGTAVGETTGTGNTATITLDTNAAGHGWFIDATPGDNSEYLATSDANVWIAKAGSTAEGKMDMLSVLLHEYGHALGFEHSANTSDFMSASLVAGERRLPTADELTLMSQLIAKLKGSDGSDSPSSPSSPFDPAAPLGGSLGLLALGRLRRNDYGGWELALDSAKTIAPQASTQYQAQYQAAQVQAAQYQGAINPTLTNGSFASDNNSINTNTPANWRVSGNIALNGNVGAVGVGNAGSNTSNGNNTIALGESANANARLSQAFNITSGDRYLSFTVVDDGLQANGADNSTGPNDAFEVALFNANTGAAFGPTDGLTRSDALLNQQLDGTNHAAR